jgi:hypothetical protein
MFEKGVKSFLFQMHTIASKPAKMESIAAILGCLEISGANTLYKDGALLMVISNNENGYNDKD